MSTPRNTGPEPLRRYHIARVATALGSAALAGVLAGLVACSEAPGTAPTSAPRGPDLATLRTPSTVTAAAPGTVVNTLLWRTPATAASASRVIGSSGGTVEITNGVRLVVPKGAVSTATTFTVTRLPGFAVAYDFQPHGTKFAVPVQIQQPTSGLTLFQPIPPGVTSLSGAYFPDASTLDPTKGTVAVSEFEPTFVSADKNWITFSTGHFSGYVVAWGRQ